MRTRLFKHAINFKCIANKCLDSCCTGWDISFDKATYNNLSKDPYFKKTMADYAYINDSAYMVHINYGIISLNKDGRCPFLDQDDLCAVQKTQTEGALSNVCALYPRYYNMVDGIYEESLSLACIAATELLLLGEPLELIEIAKNPKRDLILQKIETDDDSASDMSCLYDFRTLIFELMRNDTYTLDEKLGLLMAFHTDIEDLDERKLKLALASYDFTNKQGSIPLDETSYKKLIALLKRVGKSGHVELDELIEMCIQDGRYEPLKLHHLSRIDGIMSNYMIHQMFKELYPYINGYSKMASFQHLLKKVQILRLLIAYDGNFDDKRVARVIQMYSKGLEHHGAFHYELEDLIL